MKHKPTGDCEDRTSVSVALQAAKDAKLRYVTDASPGIHRLRSGKHFRYIAPDGSPVRDADTLKRIKSLAIPPAYRDVWICPSANGHLQATGRDARGRKQYRYHPRWREVRDVSKYDRTLEFARCLPALRNRVDEDLKKSGMPRERILATVVRLLESTLIRVGNEEYAKANKSFGLTTMRNRHVTVDGDSLSFRFKGKSGKSHNISVRDRALARIVKRCRELPGQELFEYIDETGEVKSVGSGDVNEYLREITGHEFTAKDFRTWAGTKLAAGALSECPPGGTEAETKRNIVRAVEQVSSQLGNTASVCRKCYVHPAILSAYIDGKLELTGGDAELGLPDDEAAVLALLERCSSPSGRSA